jgi:four helix bundle protein
MRAWWLRMTRDHRKLDAFHLADELAVAIYQVTMDFPRAELYGLRSQLRRASVSVPTNIVEGCARESDPEYLRFLEVALASAREVLYLVDLSRRLTFIKQLDANRVTLIGDRTAGALVNLRKSYGR